jgi:hypothetical protein
VGNASSCRRARQPNSAVCCAKRSANSGWRARSSANGEPSSTSWRSSGSFRTILDRDAPVALLRYALLETGRRLVERDQMSTVDDVFFLEFEEVDRALAQRSPVSEVVVRRKAERNWVLANPGPASYGQVPSPPPSMASFPKEARESAEAVLWSLEKTFATKQSGQVQHDASNIRGIAASSGSYTGTVRVIKDESEFTASSLAT